MARHCSKCELPMIICACAEAAAYDKAHPFVDPIDTSHLGPIKVDYLPEVVPEGCRQVGWQIWKGKTPQFTELVSLNESLTDADKRTNWFQRPVYVRN